MGLVHVMRSNGLVLIWLQGARTPPANHEVYDHTPLHLFHK
jgi:hypothetical protein